MMNDFRMRMCKNHKWFNWLDDNVFYYVYDIPNNTYNNIRHWFKCNFNKYHWRTVKCAMCGYPWDGGFITELEECKIDEAIHYFKHNQRMVDEQYQQIMRTLKIAKNLLHVINNEASDFFTFEGEFKSIPNDHGTYTIDSSGAKKIYTGPYINIKNAHRFLNTHQLNNEYYMTNCKEDIYLAKATHLYYKLRERYTIYWWD